MSKRHLLLSSLLSSHRMVSRKGARLELADVISFRDQRTTYIVNCSHFRPPFSLFVSLPSASCSPSTSISLPPVLSVGRCVCSRECSYAEARARALRARIMPSVKLRKGEHGSLCPFKRSRVKWMFSRPRAQCILIASSRNYLLRIPFYEEISGNWGGLTGKYL